MESSSIVEKLEAVCHTPSLRLNDDLQQKAQDISNKIIFPMVAFLFNRIYSNTITEEEKEWFRKDRESRAAAMLGRDHVSLEDWEKEAGGKETFKASEQGMAELSKFLKEHKQDDGPFILGSQVCYTDLMVVGIARFYRQVNDDAYDKLMESVVGLKELCEACNPWFQRSNY
jgi:glutathione S-transferase